MMFGFTSQLLESNRDDGSLIAATQVQDLRFQAKELLVDAKTAAEYDATGLSQVIPVSQRAFFGVSFLLCALVCRRMAIV
jgi:hypothetical protein